MTKDRAPGLRRDGGSRGSGGRARRGSPVVRAFAGVTCVVARRRIPPADALPTCDRPSGVKGEAPAPDMMDCPNDPGGHRSSMNPISTRLDSRAQALAEYPRERAVPAPARLLA